MGTEHSSIAHKKKGISLIWVHIIMLSVSIITAGALFGASLAAQSHFNEIQRVSDGYLKCTIDLHDFDEASDYLTNRAREFVTTGHRESLDNYVASIYTERKRETTVADIQYYFPDGEINQFAGDAIHYSDELAKVEMYSIRLAANGYGITELPSSIASITIKDSDLALPPEEQIGTAKESLFDENYLLLKKKIDDSIDSAFSSLIRVSDARHEEASNRLNALLVVNSITLPLMIAFLAGYGILTYIFVFSPLKKGMKAIEEDRDIDVEGAREVQFLSESYNAMHRLHKTQEKALKYEVGHDILTGLFNRHDYMARCNESAKDELYYVIGDIDRFKGINDTYGHASGDHVLTEFARRLREAFLNHDTVYRIGGDEFVIMVESSDKASLEKRLIEVNHTFEELSAQGHTPQASMSFGAVWKTKDMSFEEAYRKADKALYTVKGKGGKSVAFYDEFGGKQ